MKTYRIILLVSLCMSATLAHAHTHLESSVPAKGAIVHAIPKTVTLHFSEALELAMCKLTVQDSKSGEIVNQSPFHSGTDSNSLEVNLKPLSDQKKVYTVHWKAVSKDTHKMQGSFDFIVDPKPKK